MMRKLFASCILSLFIACAPLSSANAISISISFPSLDFKSMAAMYTLKNSIVLMARKINVAASHMMKYGDMLVCNAEHGENSYYTLNMIGFSFSVHWVEPFTWLSGWILLILGFFIMLLAAFYIFDVAFNLAISLFLLPLCLALWPFGWTKDKLKTNIEGITYYVGIFIFLPMGILIAVKIVEQVMKGILKTGVASEEYQLDFETAFLEDQSDLIRDHLGIDSFDFWKIFFCYIVALRVIPLMATEFCTHFFSSSAVGNPMSDKLSQGIQVVKNATVGRAGRYGADVLKHQSGRLVQRMGNQRGGWFRRSLYRYGKQLAKTKRRG